MKKEGNGQAMLPIRVTNIAFCSFTLSSAFLGMLSRKKGKKVPTDCGVSKNKIIKARNREVHHEMEKIKEWLAGKLATGSVCRNSSWLVVMVYLEANKNPVRRAGLIKPDKEEINKEWNLEKDKVSRLCEIPGKTSREGSRGRKKP